VAEESQYLSFHGIRVHFRIASCEDTPRERILLLSSPLISTFHWRKIVPELTQMGCLVVLADLPGFGRSDCSMAVPQDSAMRANMLWGVLDEIDRETGAPDSMWHLAGHGSACAAILEMGAMYPDSVKSQVHISPLFSIAAPREEDPTLWYRQSIFEKDNFRRMIEHCSAYPMDDYIIDRMRAPLLRPGARQNFLRMLRAGRKECQGSLGFCPAMAILGGRDALLQDTDLESIRSHLAGAEMHTLKSAGHFPMETHSKALRDYLRGWIHYNAQEA
jgi:pimeloyl-ACP methyl ester carboxylesterase